MTKIGICDNCQEEAKVLRCTKCKKVQYCSRACQKNHWKLLHRYTCSPVDDDLSYNNNNLKFSKHKMKQKNSMEEDTAKELMMSIHEMSIQEAHTKYLSLQEEIDKLKKKENERNLEYQAFARQAKIVEKRKELTNVKRNVKTIEPSSNQLQKPKPQDKKQLIAENANSMKNKVDGTRMNITSFLSSNHNNSSGWLYTVEFLKNISCFLILLMPTKNIRQKGKNIIPQKDEIKIDFEHTLLKNFDQNTTSYNTRIHITRLSEQKSDANHSNLLNILLPGKAHETDATLTIHSDSIFLRIKYSSGNQPNISSFPYAYNQTLHDNEPKNIININNCNSNSSSNSLPDQFNSLRCRSCNFYLLQKKLPPTVQNSEEGVLSNKSLSRVNIKSKIEKVHPLPTGYWDEISDYLTCTADEPKIPFDKSSCKAIPNQALEDGNVVVLHKLNLDNRISIISNVNGYGEFSTNSLHNQIHDSKKGDNNAKDRSGTDSSNLNRTNGYKGKEMNDVYQDSVIYRGVRIWKDAVGGETVCCSQCYSILGFSLFNDPNSIRILKHRVSAGEVVTIHDDENQSHDRSGKDLHPMDPDPVSKKFSRGFLQNNTCGSFIAQEMIRYAESQAVYKFVVIGSKIDTIENDRVTNDMKCMVLHLLSWDTNIATNHGVLSVDKNDLLCFHRVLKIAFEEKDSYEDSTQNNDSTNDAYTNWIWTGADFCCPPNVSFGKDMKMNVYDTGKENHRNLSKSDLQEKEKKDNNNSASQNVASVRMYLMEEEFIELQHLILNGTSYFSKSVSELTLQLKLGKDKNSKNSRSGLSLLQFIN